MSHSYLDLLVRGYLNAYCESFGYVEKRTDPLGLDQIVSYLDGRT